MPVVVTLVLWTMADFLIYPLFYALAGDNWPSVLLRSLVSAAVGIPLYALLVRTCAKVEVLSETSSAL